METEEEVLSRFFLKKKQSNLPKRVTTRRVRQPKGPARFDPQSLAWRETWEVQESEKKEEGGEETRGREK